MSESKLNTLLLLPGTLCDERVFARTQRALRGRAHVIPASYQGMKNRSTWLAALLAQLPDRFYVAGFSLGGLFALEILRLAETRVMGIALIASNAQEATHRSERKSAALRRIWLDRGPSEVAKHVKPAYFHYEATRRRYQSLIYDMAMKTSKRSAFEEFEWAAQRPDGLQVLSRFQGRVLAVSGRQDRLCPPSWQRAMLIAQPNTQWNEFDRCGHFLPLEAPAKLAHVLRHWIAPYEPQDALKN
jgi:pimeloyl-ACP methyl ester carboxylesterase